MRKTNPTAQPTSRRPGRPLPWLLLLLASCLLPATASAQVVCYRDLDSDTWGDDADTVNVPDLPCPTDYVDRGGDCNDSNSNISPDAIENVADGVDQNCDGTELCWRDDDLDTYGSDQGATIVSADLSCTDPFESDLPLDCDDADSGVNPDAAEICDGQDNDCNGIVDDGIIPPPCALQVGVCSGSTQVCGGVAGFLACDASSYGASYEVSESTCDLLDNDCDGIVDEEVCTPPSVPSMNGWGHLVMALFLLGFAIPSLVDRRPSNGGAG